MDVRFTAYRPDGTVLGALPFPETFNMTTPRNDMSALEIQYPQGGVAADILRGPVEVVMEVRNPATNTYFEPPGCRFLNIRRSYDAANPGSMISYTMPSFGWMLRKVRTITDLRADGRKGWALVDLGVPLAQLLGEAQSTPRNNVPTLEWTFTPEQDTAGQFWAEFNLIILINGGQDYWSFLDALSRQGMCDWRFNGKELQIYNPDTVMARQRRHVILRPYVDFLTDQRDFSFEDVASKVFMQGDDALSYLAVGVATPGWGEWEEFSAQPGVTSQALLQDFSTRILEQRSTTRAQVTRSLPLNRQSQFLPYVDYLPGDYITSTDAFDEQDQPMRVEQITISSGPEGEITGTLVLNDWFLDRELRNSRILNGLTGFGGPGTGGGTTGWRWR